MLFPAGASQWYPLFKILLNANFISHDSVEANRGKERAMPAQHGLLSVIYLPVEYDIYVIHYVTQM